MYTQIRNTIFKALMATVLVLLVMVFASAAKYALATALDTASGWGWGGGVTTNPVGYEGIGWISFNNTDCDTNDDGSIDNAACGTVGAAISPYGVNIPVADGLVSGYAWSEHYGWISFNGADLAGCTPVLSQATRVGNSISGGARILAIRDAVTVGNAGGFDGCISLSGAGYGVILVGSTLDGYAWSSDLGWINFGGNGGNVIYTAPAPTVTLTVDKPSIKLGDSINLTWTVTGTPADSCVASGDWSGNKTLTGGSEPLTPASVGVKTYNLECFALGASSGIKTVTVTIPSVDINISTCAIPVGSNQCSTATTFWTFNNATPNYLIKSDTTGATIYSGPNVNSSAPGTQLNYGLNTFYGWHNNESAAGDHIGSQTFNVGCVAGAEWSSLITNCQNPPSINISANPKIVRSGQKSSVGVTVDSLNRVECSLISASTPPPALIIHDPIGGQVQTQSRDTSPLTSTRIVTVQCTDTVTGLVATDDVRIEVVPTIQEI